MRQLAVQACRHQREIRIDKVPKTQKPSEHSPNCVFSGASSGISKWRASQSVHDLIQGLESVTEFMQCLAALEWLTPAY